MSDPRATRRTSSSPPGGRHRRATTAPLPASVSPGSASKPEPRKASSAQRLLDGLIILIITLMPFHAFMSVSLGSWIGQQTLIQSWKEIVLLIAGILVIAVKKQTEILAVLRRPVNLMIIAFAGVTLLVSLATEAYQQPSFWFGVKTDLGFLLAFILAQFTSARIKKPAIIGLLAATTLVVVFGVLQATVLPADFLARFGYSASTIEPYGIVDPAVSAYRILSTLGGPNQLGSFLILPICLMTYLIWRRRQWLWILPLAMAFITLYYTYSRSALLGTATALAMMLFAQLKAKGRLALVGLSVLAIGVTAFSWNKLLANNATLQAYLLHGSIFEQRVVGSDEGRVAGVRQGIEAIRQQPQGKGLGTAGPASYHGDSGIITENYYLQIAIEAGIIGVLLFFAITAATGRRLWRGGATPIMAALAGLTVTNLFLHTWADSSTALTFWTVAGLKFGEHFDEFI